MSTATDLRHMNAADRIAARYPDRCPGSSEYIGFTYERTSADTAPCPTCGRATRFHRITGRFARHNKPAPPVAEGVAPQPSDAPRPEGTYQGVGREPAYDPERYRKAALR